MNKKERFNINLGSNNINSNSGVGVARRAGVSMKKFKAMAIAQADTSTALDARTDRISVTSANMTAAMQDRRGAKKVMRKAAKATKALSKTKSRGLSEQNVQVARKYRDIKSKLAGR